MNIKDRLKPGNVEKYRGKWEAFEARGGLIDAAAPKPGPRGPYKK